MEARFKRDGYDTITAYVPSNGLGCIQDSACQVAVMLQEIRPFYDKIVLCGHSMGGLINRVIIQHLGFTDVDAYVSLGTPHQGTILARLAPWSKSATQMTIGSLFLESLNNEPWPENIPALAIQAQFEQIVLPQKNAKITFGENKTVYGVGHVTIPLAKSTYYKVSDWLKYDVFQQVLPEDTPDGISSKLVIQDDPVPY